MCVWGGGGVVGGTDRQTHTRREGHAGRDREEHIGRKRR